MQHWPRPSDFTPYNLSRKRAYQWSSCGLHIVSLSHTRIPHVIMHSRQSIEMGIEQPSGIPSQARRVLAFPIVPHYEMNLHKFYTSRFLIIVHQHPTFLSQASLDLLDAIPFKHLLRDAPSYLMHYLLLVPYNSLATGVPVNKAIASSSRHSLFTQVSKEACFQQVPPRPFMDVSINPFGLLRLSLCKGNISIFRRHVLTHNLTSHRQVASLHPISTS